MTAICDTTLHTISAVNRFTDGSSIFHNHVWSISELPSDVDNAWFNLNVTVKFREKKNIKKHKQIK